MSWLAPILYIPYLGNLIGRHTFFKMFFVSWLTASLLLTATHAAVGGKQDEDSENPVNTTRVHTHDAGFKPDFYLSVTYENHNVACEQRMSVLVNGTSPGPALRLPAGKTSWVRVCNNMDEFNTTIHWHGLSQRTAPFSDGSPVSQWPIAPHKCFDYEIHPEQEDAGTYFYHSHVGVQAMSAAGPLIVEDFGLPPFQYDEERIVFVQDYYNKSDETIEKGLTGIPFVWSGETNAVLLNGVGVAIGRQAGQGDCKLPVIDVEPGKTYRFRFIGATAISIVKLGIEGHSKLDVIEADGSYTQPYTIDHMQVSTGQRLDALLKTKSASELDSKTDYVIQFETRDRPTTYTGFAILRYPGSGPKTTTAPTVHPLQLSNTTYDYLEYALQPLHPNNFPKASEVTRRVHVTMAQILDSLTIWQVDGLNWTESTPKNTPPYLVSIYENGPAAMPNYTAALENGGWDPHTLTFPAKLGEVLEIVLENTGSLVKNNGGLDIHPMHIHGAHVYDCGSGNGTYDPVENERKLANYNPVKRDTTNLYRYATKGVAGQVASWRVWRIRVEDAGVWMLHCHILQHMIMGMQSVWIMGDYEDIAKIPYRGAEGYLTFGGTAYGGDGEVESGPVAWHNWDSKKRNNA
ncbi:L-ascorbate oxidase [Pyrenophora seminiperda CCB06]|uniref:L-ascorbate oxidase n=1 Tax=Pyrenophora seminiperda CCB06 TaxID=1302712 RepID=A0A3M7M0G9_9PLEO|nr:L-ascorbate oxidase [Pyrenophora seminiperda CCB06]